MNSTQLAQALASIVRRHLPEALRELLNVLGPALAEQRFRAFSNQESQACDDFLRFCKNQGERVVEASCQAICLSLSDAAGEPTQQAAVALSEWSLVDDDEVEDLLLARRLATRLRESLGVLEWRVCGCFNRLAGRHVADADNPLSLESLARQVQDGLRLRARPAALRNLYLVEAGRVLPDALRPYLQALSAEFEAQRVEPLPQPEALLRTRVDSHARQSPSGDAARTAIHRLRGSSEEGAVEAASGGVSVAETLAQLQAQSPPPGGWDATQLLAQMERQDCVLTPRQREDTHLVSEVFQALAVESALAPDLRPMVQRLMLPVLTATLEEPAALADSGHPVRAALDRILRLCDYCEPPNQVLEARLQQLVERLVNDSTGDGAAFAACDAELDELLSMQQRAYRRSVERVMQLHRGQDVLANAQREVAAALAALYGERVPKLLLDWLDCGWRDLLVNELIRSGDDMYAWKGDLALTSLLQRRLLDAAQAPVEEPRENAGSEVEQLLQILRRRMDEFGAGQYQFAQVLRDLRSQLLGQEPVELVAPPVPPQSSQGTPVVAESLQRWQERLEAVQEGDWLQTADGGALQMIWRNPQMDHYVLVDNQGHEAGSYGSAELLGMLADGELLVDEAAGPGQSLIQRTLQDIVGRLYREIAHARSHDELTGLLNRRSFEGGLAQSLAASTAPAFLMAHIDQFSLINGHAGPVAGDACLRQVASRLRQWLPDAESLARVGGVEFAAVLPGCSEARAAALAEDLRIAVEAEGFAWNGRKHGLTLSVGVVEAAERRDVANLFGDLQSACNRAKEGGRNRVHRFSADADAGHVEILAIAARVDDIVEREELSLRVQQIAPAAPDSAEAPHYELLLVMQNELPLQDFIAAAERYHRMTKVDRWVLRRIFSELERHPQLWQSCAGLSINLSGSSLNDDRLLGYIESLFERYAVDPRRICFELTETAAVANLAKTADLVRHLQRSGCRFSIDDFGVGFSSFDYLKRLPVDYVKIDGSFVKEIERSPSDLAMVRSINEVAHALGRRTVAEYVETPSIRACLAEMGVDYVQGFGVQKPRHLADWLREELPQPTPC